MQLSFDEANFLMNLITEFTVQNGEVSHYDGNGNEILTYPEIEGLWHRIQDVKLSQVVG